MTPEREALVRVLQDAVWPFLAHDPANPDLFWGQMARKVEEHYAAEVERLRAQMEAVKQVAARHDRSRGACVCSLCATLRDVHAWAESPTVSQIVDAALASGDEVQRG